MFIGEPPTTAYDLHFQLGRIPVRVHPFFWLLGLILGLNLAQSVNPEQIHPGGVVLIVIAVVFVSILVHELGHAFMMRHFGRSPRIVLHSFGGLAIADSMLGGFGRQRQDPRQDILVSAAGPAAGFLLAAAVMLVIQATGGSISWNRSLVFWHVDYLGIGLESGWRSLSPDQQIALLQEQLSKYRLLYVTVNVLLSVNILWGLMNLLPVYPLDGGQIARELLTLRDPWQGIARSLWLSIIVAAGMAVFVGLMRNDFFILILFGMLAYSNYVTLQQFTGRGGGWGGGWR